MTSATSPKAVTRRGGTRRAGAEKPKEPGAGAVGPPAVDEQNPNPEILEDAAPLEATAPEVLEDVVAVGGVADLPASLEEEADEEDVEPGLDVLMTGMLAPEGDGVDDDADSAGPEIAVVPAARLDEFVCTACFLIWNRRQLADPVRRLCLDCREDAGPLPAPAPSAAA
jgi:hypothetical protein